MQQTQIVSYGIEGVLLERLRAFAQVQRVWLRETNQLSACRTLVHSAPPSVLVMLLGRDLEKELAFLEQAHACLPQTRCIALGEADNPALAGLAWELGATFALFPPMPVDHVTELIVGLLPDSAR